MDVAIGDSIAVGVGQALGIERVAKVGATSCYIFEHVPNKKYDTVIISAGVNDGSGPHCLRQIREKVQGKKVVWIKPAKYAGEEVDMVAREFGDTVVSYTAGPDGVHPKDNSKLAE